jgi:serine/threonine protein phosphatase PrpC
MRAKLESVAGNPENQDRGVVIEASIGLVMSVADGAGGQSGGAEAAVMAVESVRQKTNELPDVNACAAFLQSMDQAISKDRAAGETTCALAVVTRAGVYGASVGDSGVWVINESGFINLTERQSRKPFIGSGSAWPSPFEYKIMGRDSLLLATDGLLKYTSSERIVTVCRDEVASHVPRRLIELVRYPSGALPDDVTVIFASCDSRWTS